MKYIDASCPYCGAPVIMDNNGRGLCEYCGQWVIYDNRSSKYVLEDAYRAGYDFEKGRQAAQAEAETQSAPTYTSYQSQPTQSGADPSRRRHTGWWIVGWIFMYPIPLTILMARNKSLPWWGKALIIAAGWASYMLLMYYSR